MVLDELMKMSKGVYTSPHLSSLVWTLCQSPPISSRLPVLEEGNHTLETAPLCPLHHQHWLPESVSYLLDLIPGLAQFLCLVLWLRWHRPTLGTHPTRPGHTREIGGRMCQTGISLCPRCTLLCSIGRKHRRNVTHCDLTFCCCQL